MNKGSHDFFYFMRRKFFWLIPQLDNRRLKRIKKRISDTVSEVLNILYIDRRKIKYNSSIKLLKAREYQFLLLPQQLNSWLLCLKLWFDFSLIIRFLNIWWLYFRKLILKLFWFLLSFLNFWVYLKRLEHM